MTTNSSPLREKILRSHLAPAIRETTGDETIDSSACLPELLQQFLLTVKNRIDFADPDLESIFSTRTLYSISHDLIRASARVKRNSAPPPMGHTRLNLGCGTKRRLSGWVNVDLYESDYDVDLTSPKLPWPDSTIEEILLQEVAEHLDINFEWIPLLCELRRICKPGAQIWITTPDMAKVCSEYVTDKGNRLLSSRIARWNTYSQLIPDGIPCQHFINELFHQSGGHINLFDWELLQWSFRQAGIEHISLQTYNDFKMHFPSIARDDEIQSLFACGHIESEPVGAIESPEVGPR